MPLVHINTAADRNAAVLQTISDAIQDAMVATIGIPADDRFHLFSTNSTRIYDHSYLGISRTPSTIFIEITLRSGRTPEQKKNLYREVATRAGAAAGVTPADVFIVLRENGAGDWSFGEGAMQYEHLLEPVAH